MIDTLKLWIIIIIFFIVLLGIIFCYATWLENALRRAYPRWVL